MIKHVILLIVLSLLAIIFIQEIHPVVHALVQLYKWLNQSLSVVFSGNRIGRIISSALSLIIIPLAFGLIIDFVYWLIKRQHLTYMWSLVWGLWLILIVTIR